MRRIALATATAALALLPACKKPPLTAQRGHLIVLDGATDVTGKGDDFGQTCQNVAVARTLTLSGGPNITRLTASGPFAISNPPAGPVATSPALALTLTFTPISTGSQLGTLTILSDGDQPVVTVDLQGEVVNAPATPTLQSTCQFKGTPRQPCAFLDFGDVPVGASATQTVTVENLGCPPLTFAAALKPDGGPYTLGAVPSPLLLGQSADFTVTFAPSSTASVPGLVVLTTNDPSSTPGQPAGLFDLTLTGFGGAAALTLNPASQTFESLPPHVAEGATFTVHNGGTAQVVLAAPALVEADDAGAFTLDAGWPAGAVLDAGDDVSCTVVADLPAPGVYGSTLSVSGGGGAALTASINANSLGCLAATPSTLTLGDAGEFCGSATGTVMLGTCSDGGIPVTVTSIGFAAGGNTANLLSLQLPSGGPPWVLSPGGAPLDVGVTFQDNGLLDDDTTNLLIASDAFGQPQLTVAVIPQPARVPKAGGVPQQVDGGSHVGQARLFQVQPSDSANFAYQFYWVGQGAPGNPVDAGLVPLSGVAGADVVFIPEVATGSGSNTGYRVCVDEFEIDAGFGTCHFDAGSCSATFTVN